MTVKLIGFRKLDFTSGTDKVKGTQIFVGHLDDDTHGLLVDKLFVKNDEIIAVNLFDFIDKELDVDFGFKGKVQCISAI